MAHQYRHSANQSRPIWMTGLLAGAVVLALPWLAFQGRQLVAARQPPSLQTNTAYNDALSTGWNAAVAVQSAASRQEWESVINQWDHAIRLLRKTGDKNPKAVDLVNTKIAEYQGYREYAKKQADNILLPYQWAGITEIGGGRSYIVVDPDPYDTLMSGPILKISSDNRINNIDYVNRVLDSINLPPITSSSIEILSNYYKVKDYPLGELLLHRSICRESFGLSDRYDCLLKITVQPKLATLAN